MMKPYDAAQLRAAAYRESRARARRHERVAAMPPVRAFKRVRLVLRQTFCRHQKRSQVWLRDHPELIWIYGERCTSCRKFFALEQPWLMRQPEHKAG